LFLISYFLFLFSYLCQRPSLTAPFHSFKRLIPYFLAIISQLPLWIKAACKANPLIAQGSALGESDTANQRPTGAKAFGTAPASCSAFALSARPSHTPLTQGVALGYVLLPRRGVLGQLQ
jgi:hypothetical protein